MEPYTDEQVLQLKNIEYYSQSVAATFNTAMEEEKTYVILSVAAIGFLFNINPNEFGLKVVIFFAMLFFLGSLIISIKIFVKNKYYLIHSTLAKGKDENSPEKKLANTTTQKLNFYSKANRYFFILGVALSVNFVFLNFFVIEAKPEKTEKPTQVIINYLNPSCVLL